MVLQSSLTGFDVEWIEGVQGEDIPDKALPLVGLWRKYLCYQSADTGDRACREELSPTLT
jgi:hypothetical protein